MFSTLSTRVFLSRAAAAFFVAAQLFGWVTPTRASEMKSAAEDPPPHSPAAARRALREFDRFLDHHPLLEDELRLDPRRVSDAGYLQRHALLREFLQANPDAALGLELYPHYFLNRALLRQASAPVTFAELVPLKELFEKNPELERALTINPAEIRDPNFLSAQSDLRAVLNGSPVLARVFLPANAHNPH